jgi:Phage conserved hypothetical protein BR0599/Uncharacterized conserved protein (DUF2163)
MKNASASAIAILSGGKYLRAELYVITLKSGATYYFTSFELPLTAAIYPSVTNNNYLTGLTIIRDGSTTQAVGLDSQEMEITIAPQFDNPGGAPLIGGYSVMQAARLGILDNASILYAKLFMNMPAPGALLDTSPGGIGWFRGVVADLDVQRFGVKLKISSDLLVLNQVQMPRNLYQGSCVHTVYDAGCAILASSFTHTSTVSAITSSSQFTTGLTGFADGYFSLGVLKFTSGANNGFSLTVKNYFNSGGNIQLAIPMPATITPGDAFSVYPGCDLLLNTCVNKFANGPHFKATPFVPVPETLYDGGTSPGTAPAPGGGQRGKTIGSAVGGQIIQQGN